MIGAIIGDVLGSSFEHHATKSTDFPLFPRGSRFTDDAVMTVATAQAILDEIRRAYAFDVSCQGSVPEALICFLDTDGLESAIRAAISLGGDADTQAAIAGAAAAAFDGHVEPALREPAVRALTPELRVVLDRFEARFPSRRRA